MHLITTEHGGDVSHATVYPQNELSGESDESEDAGFTLVEMMVVLLVISILLAIAIPTFLGTTAVATSRSAQANLNTAYTDAKLQFQNNGQTFYVNGIQDPAGLANILTSAQLSLAFHAGSAGSTSATGSSGSPSVVSIAVSIDGNGLVMAAYSMPGNCYYLVENTSGLNAQSKAAAPYSGGTAVTTSAVVVAPGPIDLPAGSGTNYVTVAGDTSSDDCNADTPKASGSSTTVQYLTSGFPS